MFNWAKKMNKRAKSPRPGKGSRSNSPSSTPTKKRTKIHSQGHASGELVCTVAPKDDRAVLETMLQRMQEEQPDRSASPYFAYLSLFRHVMHAMGLEGVEMSRMEGAVLADDSFQALRNRKGLSVSDRRDLLALVVAVDRLFALQRPHTAAAHIQRIVRGFLARRRVTRLRLVYNHRRNNAFHELMRKERTYVKSLETIVEQYLLPLSTTDDRALKESIPEYRRIFSNVEDVLSLHRAMLRRFYEVAASWPDVSQLADVLIEKLPGFSVYEQYVNGYKISSDVVQRHMERNEKFVQFLRSRPIASSVDLEMLLALPLNVISTYELHVEAMWKATPEEAPDYQSLLSCLSILRETNRFVSESLVQSEHRAMLHNIQSRLVAAEELRVPQLIRGKRQYVREGNVEITHGLRKPAPGYIYLLSDLIVVCRVLKGTAPNHQVEQVYELEVTQAGDVGTTAFSLCGDNSERALDFQAVRKRGLNDGISFGNMLDRIDKSAAKFTLSCESLIAQKDWLRDIQMCIAQCQPNRVFGMDISRLVAREQGNIAVPLVVQHCVAYLDKHATDREGIFRIPGSTRTVNELKQEYNGAGDIDLEQRDVTPPDVASLLKDYFDELPNPLCTFSQFDAIVATQSAPSLSFPSFPSPSSPSSPSSPASSAPLELVGKNGTNGCSEKEYWQELLRESIRLLSTAGYFAPL
eukprot:TRINITY_DN2768_c0_g1_i2.p1 TRINITY_DN2768_c0_g1~~TRINITY_DN2768_c0_g1_i2.p1  ORF type:complete len:726 (+),score=211.00 TRINITY_DN2768_c0_g1_i2:97-2178(+)